MSVVIADNQGFEGSDRDSRSSSHGRPLAWTYNSFSHRYSDKTTDVWWLRYGVSWFGSFFPRFAIWCLEFSFCCCELVQCTDGVDSLTRCPDLPTGTSLVNRFRPVFQKWPSSFPPRFPKDADRLWQRTPARVLVDGTPGQLG